MIQDTPREVPFGCKAQSAVNGCSLNLGCNAELGHLGVSLRARREAIICGVASLVKGLPFPARRALHPKGTSCGAQLMALATLICALYTSNLTRLVNTYSVNNS